MFYFQNCKEKTHRKVFLFRYAYLYLKLIRRKNSLTPSKKRYLKWEEQFELYPFLKDK